MLLLGCKPAGRFTEQHDVFFGIGKTLSDLIPQVINSWKDSGKIHIDSWREVTNVDGNAIRILEKDFDTHNNDAGLFFLNLGGYKPGDLEEYHYKILVVAKDKAEAIKRSKQTAFYLHTGFKGAESHIDDKYGIDIDDIYAIEEILPAEFKNRYSIHIEKSIAGLSDDELHPGYLKLSSL
jgi:hypothetical protein